MGPVYSLTIRQMTGRWRLVIMTLLAAMPVLLTLLMLSFDSAPSVVSYEGIVFGTLLAGAITPLVVLAIATAAFGNEVEDRTLANLTISPVPRWQIALPKLLAVVSVAAPFAVLSAFVTAWLAYLGDVTAVIAATASVLVAVLLYSAAFLWLGLVSTQAVGIGLLYIVLWEGLFAGYVSGARSFSIRYHSIALMNMLDARRFAEGPHIGAAVVLTASIALLLGFLLLSIRRLRRMDVP